MFCSVAAGFKLSLLPGLILSEITIPRPSATVLLARESAGAPELLMVQRHARSAFGDAYAFPGGVLDDTDADVHDYCAGRSAAAANRILGVESGGLDFYVAAIRELFEETGILLATQARPVNDLAAVRECLNDETQSWSEFVRGCDACMLCDQLHYFSHWITPDHLPKRYTTRFFVAEWPAGQVAQHDERELTNSAWISATDALQAGKDGSMILHYPTRKTLESLAGHQSLGELVSWASACEAEGIEAIRPSRPGATQ